MEVLIDTCVHLRHQAFDIHHIKISENLYNVLYLYTNIRTKYLTLPSESASSFRKRFSSRESSSFENPLALRIAGDNAEFPIMGCMQFQKQFDCK